MSLFNFGNRVTTKLFISQLPTPKKSDSSREEVVPKGVISAMVATKLIEVAPELVEEGFKVLSSSIANFTQDYESKTVVRKNINGDKHDKIFLPPSIRIVRANFPKDINDKKNSCFDGYGEHPNSCKELSDRKLQIELDIIKSSDGNSFYFQPSNYFYCGKDSKKREIDELTLSFAFVMADENLSDLDAIEFREIINFGDLDSEHDYNFKIDEKRYDTSYQSPWISSELSKKGVYTMLFQIKEKKNSNSFNKFLNKIYKNHEDELKKKINKEIKAQLKR